MTAAPLHKILLVDDESAVLDLLVEMTAEEFVPLTATSAEDGMKLLQTHARDIVCIVSDYSMSGLNGLDFRRQTLNDYKDIPFVLLSGHITKDDALAAIDARINAFEPKPFKIAHLQSVIASVSADRIAQIIERDTLAQIFFEEATSIIDELEPLIMSLESRPSDMETINTIFRLVHTIKGSSGVLESAYIRAYAHKYEDLLSKLKTGQIGATGDIVSILLQGADVLSRMIASVKCGEFSEDVDQLVKVFEITGKGAASSSAGADASSTLATAKQDAVKDNVSVPATLLDEFMELSGEITVIRNMVNKLVKVIDKERPGDRNVQHLSELLEEMHKINSGMQGRLVETRKVPCARVFKPLPRTVRDTGKALGKSVTLKIEGDDVRVDTSLAQALSESLTHIVRNSMDHGIESAEKRKERLKSPEGSIVISAVERGEEVVVSIRDDGAGLDTARIKKKAVERGLYSEVEVENLSEQKVFGLIFESGFSTAAQVTDVSGRGVGMDMVRSSVSKVKGRIDIQSAVGVGTTFSLHLPVPKSVLIVSSLLVEVAGRSFAVPQENITRLLRIEAEKISTLIRSLEGAFVLVHDDALLPIVDLGRVLNLRNSAVEDYLKRDLMNILVVRTEASVFALMVDQILDAEEIVVKSVGNHLDKLMVYLGATFMGDGRVGLILNVEGIAHVASLNRSTAELTAALDGAPVAKEAPANVQEYLLFDLFCRGLYALPLDVVHRLEEVPASSLKRTGGNTVMIYRKQIAVVLDLTETLRLSDERDTAGEEQTVIPMVVLHHEGHYVCLCVKQIKDVVLASRDVDSSACDRVEIAGTIEVSQQIISVVNTDFLTKKAGFRRKNDLLPDMKFGPEEAQSEHVQQKNDVQGWGTF